MTRATLIRLVAAMLVLTAVISVVMLQIDWNGVAGSTEADDVDTLLDVMIAVGGLTDFADGNTRSNNLREMATVLRESYRQVVASGPVLL